MLAKNEHFHKILNNLSMNIRSMKIEKSYYSHVQHIIHMSHFIHEAS
jgi:hypothetical protein